MAERAPMNPEMELAIPDEQRRDPPQDPGATERPIPFVLRVATVWTNIHDLPSEGDGQLRYWQRAPLTGELASTSGGRDVSFSDLEVR
jgi:hypothetical protein